MKVVHFQRKRDPDRFSIEGYFERVRACLNSEVDVRASVLPFFSRGVLRRIWNIIWVTARQGDINHITGDVHYIALFLRKRRTLLTIHDCEILNRLSGWKRWLVNLLWYQLPARRVTAITVNSEETKRRLLDVISFPETRIHVIPVSVSEIYEPTPKLFNSACPKILQIGTKANKNVLRLAKALRGLSCELDIVGTVDEELSRELNENGIQFRCHSFPSDEELFHLYCNCDIVSFVSTYEGFGMPIVEAQRVGRVCVTSNCSSMPEVAGDGAFFVDPFDVRDIRSGFQSVIGDEGLRASLIKKGRKNATRFDSQRIADDFFNVYRRMHGMEFSIPQQSKPTIA